MNLTEQDLDELVRMNRACFPANAPSHAMLRVMLTEAAARSAVNDKREQERAHRDETERRRRQRALFMDQLNRDLGASIVQDVARVERAMVRAAARTEPYRVLRMAAAWADAATTAPAMPCEPELTPAERVWRAHKGFMR